MVATFPLRPARALPKTLKHFALGCWSPVNFEEEAHAKQGPAYAAEVMSFIDR
jgi:hypothetical protein